MRFLTRKDVCWHSNCCRNWKLTCLGVNCVLLVHPERHFSSLPSDMPKDNFDTAHNFESGQVPGGKFVNRFFWLKRISLALCLNVCVCVCAWVWCPGNLREIVGYMQIVWYWTFRALRCQVEFKLRADINIFNWEGREAIMKCIFIWIDVSIPMYLH